MIADHPHTDPGDGREECPTCGKWVWLIIHSCKGVPVAMKLTEFLLARIAEDEARDIETAIRLGTESPNGGRRWLAECEAKRQIMQRERANGIGRPDAFPWNTATLAAVYADHPDYREEWRP